MIVWLGLLNISKAQEYNVWMYSGMGMDFNTEPPTSYNSTLANWNTQQASVSDEKGNLLFYTGQAFELRKFSILDRKQNIISPAEPAWHGFAGNRFNNILIKANDSIYYLFHIAPYDNPKGLGLFYTKINRKLNNGLGGLVPFEKEINFYPLPCVGLSVCMNADSSWWLVTRSYDSLLCFKIDKTGITGPVSTYARENLFPAYYVAPFVNPDDCIMRFSHDGTFMVSMIDLPEIFSKTTFFRQTTFHTYSFDKISGKFFSQYLVELDTANMGSVQRYRDIVFSPNDSLFYVSYSNKKNRDLLVQFERFNTD
ncbi:MAG TPA: hypothetical protein VEC12_06370, partial [Bacteroidia bacterium]|nr:hypothetical protein [Bacteroidia bacterium]